MVASPSVSVLESVFLPWYVGIGGSGTGGSVGVRSGFGTVLPSGFRERQAPMLQAAVPKARFKVEQDIPVLVPLPALLPTNKYVKDVLAVYQ
jgi:hypothetical protein